MNVKVNFTILIVTLTLLAVFVKCQDQLASSTKSQPLVVVEETTTINNQPSGENTASADQTSASADQTATTNPPLIVIIQNGTSPSTTTQSPLESTTGEDNLQPKELNMVWLIDHIRNYTRGNPRYFFRAFGRDRGFVLRRLQLRADSDEYDDND